MPSWNCISYGHISMQLAPLYTLPSVLWWSFLCQPTLEPSICLSTAILPLSVLLAPFLPLHYPRPSPKTAGCTLQTPFPVNFTSISLSLRTPWPFTHPAIDNAVYFFCEQLEHFPFRFSNYYHCFKQERFWKNPKGKISFNGLSLKLSSWDVTPYGLVEINRRFGRQRVYLYELSQRYIFVVTAAMTWKTV